MKIGIVARGLTKGGVARYIENILETLDSNYLDEDSLVLFTDEKRFESVYKNIQTIYIKNNNKLFWDYIKVLPYLAKTKPDIMIYPKNIIPFTHLLFNFKRINIIHDLAHFNKEINAYPLWDTVYMRTFMKLSCKIASKTIAISEHTKQDIARYLKANPLKINVVYEGVESIFGFSKSSSELKYLLKKHDITQPFIFYSGSISPRKNLDRTLRAFYKIHNKIPHDLVITGTKEWGSNKAGSYISQSSKDRVRVLGYVTDSDLVGLYNLADFYIYPSLYEGFGLPILEAQACGCPVVASKLTSLPEVGGDSVYYINPNSENDISKAMLELANDDFLKKELISRGRQNIKKFSWDKCTKEILEVCRGVYDCI